MININNIMEKNISGCNNVEHYPCCYCDKYGVQRGIYECFGLTKCVNIEYYDEDKLYCKKTYETYYKNTKEIDIEYIYIDKRGFRYSFKDENELLEDMKKIRYYSTYDRKFLIFESKDELEFFKEKEKKQTEIYIKLTNAKIDRHNNKIMRLADYN